MVRKNSKKCLTGSGPERPNRASEDRTFDPLNIEVKYPDTAILLLKSPEKPILLAAAEALTKFAAKARGNLETLFDLNIVDSVYALVDHDDVFTRRFALKLLALMSPVRNVQAHLLRDDTCIRHFTDILANESEAFLQEFTSRILAELTSDPTGAAMLLDKFADLSFLFTRLASPDPDIAKNCVEILANALRDLRGAEVVETSKDFTYESVYELLKQPYPIIQRLALDVIEQLVMHNSDDCSSLPESFRRSGGVQRLLDILQNDEWNDLHGKVLHIIHLFCYSQKTAEFMNNTDGTKRLFDFMENTESEEFKFMALKTLVNLAESASGKKVLHSCGIIEFLVQYLENNVQPEVQATICRGLSKMINHRPAAAEISQHNPFNYILNLLTNETATWSDRQSAAFALKELLSSDFQNCINFLDSNGHEHLMRLIEDDTTPTETRVTVVQVVSALADYSPLAEDLIDLPLFRALVSVFEPESSSPAELKIATCEALGRFPINEDARRVLIHVKITEALYHLVTGSETLPVRSAATRLLLLLCSDSIIARLCVQQGHLFYMLKNRSAARAIPEWSGCVEALFGADLPMKFAYTGRLSLRDVSQDGFYVMRRSSCPFPVLEELFRLKLCPLEPIYVANFREGHGNESDDEDEDLEYLAGKQAAFDAAREVIRRESYERGIRVSEGTINAWLELKFGRLQPDPDLARYLVQLKAELNADEEAENDEVYPPNLITTSTISRRATILARFVARQLSGVDPSSISCTNQQLEMHLRAIKEKIETSVLPLGLLRFGSYLELALLFKVLADRIALPASLVRGGYGTSWIEIAVPTTSNGKSSAPLPRDYLRENYIVDLMDEPGRLIAIGSVGARRYVDGQTGCRRVGCCD